MMLLLLSFSSSEFPLELLNVVCFNSRFPSWLVALTQRPVEGLHTCPFAQGFSGHVAFAFLVVALGAFAFLVALGFGGLTHRPDAGFRTLPCCSQR
jgi:hypothetical protein